MKNYSGEFGSLLEVPLTFSFGKVGLRIKNIPAKISSECSTDQKSDIQKGCVVD